MPRVPDKIIINCNTTLGMHGAIRAQYASAKFLCDEIVESDWIEDTKPLLDGLEKACAEHDRADMKYYQFLSKLNSDLAKLINNKLDEQNATASDSNNRGQQGSQGSSDAVV